MTGQKVAAAGLVALLWAGAACSYASSPSDGRAVSFSEVPADVQAFIHQTLATGGAGIERCDLDPQSLTFREYEANGTAPQDLVLEVECPLQPPLTAPLYWVWINQPDGERRFEIRQAPFHAPQIEGDRSIWLRQPDGMALLNAIPLDALRSSPPTPGRVVLDCYVEADGRLSNCSVMTEEPAGMGFGDAALSLAPMFQLNREVQALDESSRIALPISWAFPSE